MAKKFNGCSQKIKWIMKTPHGSRIFPGCEEGKNMTILYYFILMFPPNQLTEMVRLTNRELKEKEGCAQ